MKFHRAAGQLLADPNLMSEQISFMNFPGQGDLKKRNEPTVNSPVTEQTYVGTYLCLVFDTFQRYPSTLLTSFVLN